MQNNRLRFIARIVLLVFGIAAGIYIYMIAGKSDDTTTTSAPGPIVNNQGGIQIIAVWKKTDSPKQRFQLQLNNHSGDLNQRFMLQLNNQRWDLSKYYFKDSIVLRKNGIELSGSDISENRESDMHHLENEVVFESPEFADFKEGDELTMIINNIADTPERVFTWTY